MHTVILAGTLGPTSAWTHGAPRAFLTLPEKTIFEDLVDKVLPASTEGVTICVHDRRHALVSRLNGRLDNQQLSVFEDSVPLGTAGCLKACAPRSDAKTFLLIGSSVWLDDDAGWLVEKHEQSGNALTVFCEHDPGWTGPGNERHLIPTGIFCADRIVLDHIRDAGFQDLKEQVIPNLKRAGLQVGALQVPGRTCQVSDWAAYTNVLSYSLGSGTRHEGYAQLAPDIWCGRDVKIATTARIVGPAIIGHHSEVGENAVLVGPLVLGDRCVVEDDSWLVRVVAPSQVRFPESCALTDRMIPPRQGWSDDGDGKNSSSEALKHQRGNANASLARRILGNALVFPAVCIGVISCLFAWAFQDTLSQLYKVLISNADYSAGLLVPVAAGYMVLARRELLSRLRTRISWGGVAFFGFGLMMHTAGSYWSFSSLANVGVVTCAIGLIWSIVGTAIARRMFFPLLLLYLVCPFPHRLRDLVVMPLQSLCANISATILETFGIPIERFGHVLEVAGNKIAVAEACSGLRLALAFLLVTSVVAYVIDRPRWQKVIVVASSIPIALACNVIRVVLSAVFYYLGHAELAQGAFHDGAGLMMMPLALVMILLEFKLLSNLVVPQMPVIPERIERSSVASP